jgi:hypothetical protein
VTAPKRRALAFAWYQMENLLDSGACLFTHVKKRAGFGLHWERGSTITGPNCTLRSVIRERPASKPLASGACRVESLQAGVAEWQTRRTQNPLVARPCGFDSLLRHTTLLFPGEFPGCWTDGKLFRPLSFFNARKLQSTQDCSKLRSVNSNNCH